MNQGKGIQERERERDCESEGIDNVTNMCEQPWQYFMRNQPLSNYSRNSMMSVYEIYIILVDSCSQSSSSWLY